MHHAIKCLLSLKTLHFLRTQRGLTAAKYKYGESGHEVLYKNNKA